MMKSWLDIPADSHFPLENLPYGSIFDEDGMPVACLRIGDYVVNILELFEADLITCEEPPATWDTIALFEGIDTVRSIRREVQRLLGAGAAELRDDAAVRRKAVLPISEVEVALPMSIGAFVDFYSGINHASNVGRMFRPEQPPLLPNYRHLPVGYNGRASTVMESGEPVVRPNGQTKEADAEMPSFGPTKELDFELELGFFVGNMTETGEPVPIADAESFILGAVLVNDWSARDMQRWEYQPLGPFLAKSFATSISPWIVPLEVLEPFRVAGPVQEPAVLPYLKSKKPGNYDIQLEVSIQSPSMKKPQVICRTNSRELYWSFAQQLAHQTSNGTQLQIGDLYASGTISGTEPDSFGSLLELTWRGRDKILLKETGEERTFLEDGDILTMTGWAQGDGYKIGFGEVTAQILPAPKYP